MDVDYCPLKMNDQGTAKPNTINASNVITTYCLCYALQNWHGSGHQSRFPFYNIERVTPLNFALCGA